MKVVVLYRPESEHGRIAETFIHDFKAIHSTTKLDVFNIDSREGIAMTMLYDLMQFPAILALATDGTLLHQWQGGSLPLMDEVAAYVYTS
ncbi:MAG TPA: hypothetical protein VK983_03785 [Candidatus Limnocylindrales bacterium]|nr:hypothetical protein [Candidatus Limnocylindrales bacterium]